MYSRHDESPASSCSTTRPVFPFSFFFASTPVIRQPAKEIRIYNSNWFSIPLSAIPLVPSSSDDTCASANCYPFVYTRLIEPSPILSRSLGVVRAAVDSSKLCANATGIYDRGKCLTISHEKDEFDDDRMNSMTIDSFQDCSLSNKLFIR